MKLITVLTAFCLAFLPAAIQATNYVNNGTFTAYNLNSGDTLRIAQGTFNGVVTNLPGGAVIIVAPNATFAPTTLNLWAPAGKIINNGTCILKPLGIGAGFNMQNYGNTTVNGDMSFYNGSLKTFENYAGASLTVNGTLAMGHNTTLINNSLIITTGSFAMQSSSASVTNRGIIRVSGSFSTEGQLINENTIRVTGAFNYWGGTLTNTGEITPMGAFAISSGLTYTNSCRMTTRGELNNYGTLRNNGLIWAGTTNTSNDRFVNSGTYIGGANSKLRTVTLTNYGAMRGSSHLYATGTTTLGSQGVMGVTGVTTDTLYVFDATRTNPSNMFDNQWGTIRANTVFRPFAQPDTMEIPAGCSDVFRTGGILPVKWNYFHVKQVQQTPVLTWAAEYEAGMQFEVERSYNGTDFVRIATVSASNNASYAYTDAAADLTRPFISYRIKGISTASGSIKYTEVRLVKNAQKENATVTVYPNPTVNMAAVTYTAIARETIVIRVKSNNGQQLLAKTVTAQAGVNRYELTEVKTLAPGAYVIEIAAGSNTIAIEKLVKRA